MELSTSRLSLREAEPSDASVLAAYQSDTRYLEHYLEPPDAEQIVDMARRWATDSPRVNYQLIIALGRGGPVVGCVGLRQANYPQGQAEVGIEVAPAHWGAGYAREALGALIEFGGSELGVDQLWALTTPTNGRVHRLLRGLGFSPTLPRGREARFHLMLASAFHGSGPVESSD